MRSQIHRAMRLVARPEHEWRAIALAKESAMRVLVCYLVPMALIAPIAHAAAMFMGTEGMLIKPATSQAALLWAISAFVSQMLGVLTMAAVVCLMAPLYRTPLDLGAAVRLVLYAGTPVWLAGLLLAAPLQRFPLLVIIILIALFHAAYLFYLGLHYMLKVRQSDAAEYAGIVAFLGLCLSTVVGYVGAAAGWFPHL